MPERGAEELVGGGEVAAAEGGGGVGREGLHLVEIALAGFDAEEVAVADGREAFRGQAGALEVGPKRERVGAQVGDRGPGRSVAPQFFGEPFETDRPIRFEEQDGEHLPLLAGRRSDLVVARRQRQRPQQTKHVPERTEIDQMVRGTIRDLRIRHAG
nr:hypothetical protein [Hamadaea sp.]